MLRGRGEVAECVRVVSQKQLVLGGEHSFTFDRVLLPESTQEETYHKCASSLVHSTLEGFNATLLAYGQTVSVVVVCVCAWGGGHSKLTVGEELGCVAGCVLQIGRRRQPRR